MALVFFDGFDHYAAAEISKKWMVVANPNIVLGSAYSRRAGIGQGLYLNETGFGDYVAKPFLSDDTCTFGFAYYGVGPTTYGSFYLKGGTTVQISFHHTSSGNLEVRRGNYLGTVLGSVSLPFALWVFIEIRVVISDTVGVIQIRVNGTQLLNLTGQDTKPSTETGVNIFVFAGQAGSSVVQYYIDDFYLSNGDSPDEFLGDVYVDTIWPDADGDTNDWTPNTGNRYAAVDDPTDIDDETTYVHEVTNEQKQLFSMGALSTQLGPIKAVQEVICVRKDTSPSVNIRALHRTTGDAEYEGGLIALGDSYVCAPQLWVNNPDDSQPWEPTDIDNGQFGMIFTYTTTVSS